MLAPLGLGARGRSPLKRGRGNDGDWSPRVERQAPSGSGRSRGCWGGLGVFDRHGVAARRRGVGLRNDVLPVARPELRHKKSPPGKSKRGGCELALPLRVRRDQSEVGPRSDPLRRLEVAQHSL